MQKTVDIIKSQSDERSYKYIKLANQIECLLISDPEADKSAAALDVKVGSTLDPKPLFGTAHFLEHMLFMGTEKYPEENDYSTYIKNNGGYDNAWTSLTDTNYHFECSNEGFEGALDRFAQFFIAPLLGDSSAEREMNAVDSEFNMSLQSDAWRFFRLTQTASAEESPLHRFTCGNLESLKQEGIREALLNFHKTWYSSNIMCLVVSSNQSIEKLEKLATDLFSPVVNQNVVVPDFSQPPAFTEANSCTLTRFVPVKDKDILSLYWTLPYVELEYKSQPLSYLSHLFGHEGENSLLSYLINEGYALNLSSYGDHSMRAFSDFCVDITLTKKGLENYENVIVAVFQYAQRLKEVGPKEYVFDENLKLGKTKFSFMDKEDPIDHVVSLANKMQNYNQDNIDQILRSKYVADVFDKARIQEITEALCDPNKVLLFLRSKTFDGKLKDTEYWYKTSFETEKINVALLKRMISPDAPISDKKLDLPPENNLIPDNFRILSKRPTLIATHPDADLWFFKDERYNKPKAKVGMRLYTKDCGFGTTAKSAMFAQVWDSIMTEYLREFLYAAEMASLEFSHSVSHDTLEFVWEGFNQKMPEFISDTISRIKHMNSVDLQKIFDQVKEKLLQDWANTYLAQTYRQCYTFLNTVLISQAHEKKTLIEILKTFTYAEFTEVRKDWLHSGNMLWFMAGNLQQEQSVVTLEKVRATLNLVPTAKQEFNEVQCIQVPEGNAMGLEREVEDKTNENSCLLVYYQMDQERDQMKKKLLNLITYQYLDEPTFNQLRTIEQLGYVVFTRQSSVRDVLGVWFLVQSPTKCCEHITGSFNKHIDDMRQKVKDLTDDDFKQTVSSVLTNLQEKDKSIKETFDRYWQNEFSTHKLEFDRQDKMCELTKSVTKQEWQDYFEKLFFSEKSKRIDLRYTSEAHKEEQNKQQVVCAQYCNQRSWKEFSTGDLSAFKSHGSVYPDTFRKNHVVSHHTNQLKQILENQ